MEAGREFARINSILGSIGMFSLSPLDLGMTGEGGAEQSAEIAEIGRTTRLNTEGAEEHRGKPTP